MLQLNLTKDAADGSLLIEQLFSIVCKELDQSFSFGGSVPLFVAYFSFLFLYFIFLFLILVSPFILVVHSCDGCLSCLQLITLILCLFRAEATRR